MSQYDEVLEDHNDRMGFNPEEPRDGSNSDCSEGKLRS